MSTSVAWIMWMVDSAIILPTFLPLVNVFVCSHDFARFDNADWKFEISYIRLLIMHIPV